jgi:hypothetical protein
VSLADATIAERSADDRLRESWRRVMAVKRSTQQFRARLTRTLPLVEQGIDIDEQFGEVAATMATVVHVLGWTMHDFDLLRLPDELFEVAPVQRGVRIVTGRKAT